MDDDKDGQSVPRAGAAFESLTEAEVWEALYVDPDGETPITAEVTRLVAAYTTRFKACVAQRGTVPPEVLHVKAQWPIERVAVRVLVRLMETDAVSAPGPVTRH